MNIDSDFIEPKKRNPFYSFLALFLAIALFLLSLQGYFYLMHPEPVNIPTLYEIQDFLPDVSQPFTSHRSDEVKIAIEESRDYIKQVANYIAAQSCKKADRVCQSRALFYFVRDNIQYVPDASFHDQLENPITVLKTGGADCEDMAVLLLALEKAIGNGTQLVFVPGHAYAQISIPKYKSEKWLNLEATCKNCMFNELVESSALAKKTYYEI
ncbi:transglutaminase-like domain-containing protein [Patescibacteria group bacterium]|nr:transglutaminase-like domain-containing protein [Patescibacteria group bacterium]